VRTAAVVVSWEGGATTARCVASLSAQDRPPSEIVVVDNASSEVEHERLRRELGSVPGVRLLLLDENRQFAGGLNAGARAAFAAGAERVLLLNNDTVLAPDALRLLEDAMFGRTAAIAAPKVVDLHDPARVITAGERVVLPLLCVPRTLLRYRPRGDAPYAVSGAMGCALLVTRECFEAAGGFTEEIQVYYEDVDFCLAARAHGYGAVVVPGAVVRHDGMRGFAAGLTPWAAFLKARNPWLVVRRHGTPLTWLTFVPTYAALVLASAAIWVVRGRLDVVRALARGAWAGLAAAAGQRPAPVGPPGGRA
jgi:GT2 family glycosyltransferase